MSLFNEMRDRVLSPGAFRDWKHPKRLEETSQGTLDLRHLAASGRMVADYSKVLVESVLKDSHGGAARAAFAIMQNLFPIVEAIDSDAGKYLAQAADKLRHQ